jgi:hypothetical protein
MPRFDLKDAIPPLTFPLAFSLGLGAGEPEASPDFKPPPCAAFPLLFLEGSVPHPTPPSPPIAGHRQGTTGCHDHLLRCVCHCATRPLPSSSKCLLGEPSLLRRCPASSSLRACIHAATPATTRTWTTSPVGPGPRAETASMAWFIFFLFKLF